jgi:hypothetical protein
MTTPLQYAGPGTLQLIQMQIGLPVGHLDADLEGSSTTKQPGSPGVQTGSQVRV